MSQALIFGENCSRELGKLRTQLTNYVVKRVRQLNCALQNSAGSDRLSDFMRAYDARAERALAAAQSAIALFVLILHVCARLGKDGSALNLFVVCALVALILSSILRARLAHSRQLPELYLNTLNVADVVIFLLLIWSYQFAYDHPATGVLKAPSTSVLFLLVGLRALRFHPVPLVVTGGAAIVGWLVVVVAAISITGTQSITHDYVAYLTSHQVLIGAEVEKLVAMCALTAFLAFATYRARLSLMQLDNTLEHMPHGVAMYDTRNRLIMCNAMYGEIYGMTRDEMRPGTTIQHLLELRQRRGIYAPVKSECAFAADWLSDFENALPRIQELADGRTLSIRRKRKPDGGIITTTVDISDRKRLEARLEHLAYHDALTDLANRTQLLDRLDQILAGRRRFDSVTVFCLDLDRFKEVNDTLGHLIGDALLQAVADRLRETVRDTDIIARTGGDEFIIVQAASSSDKSAEVLANRLIDAIGAPYSLSGHQVVVGVSVGVALSGDKPCDAGELIKRADLALYRAKKDGRGVFRFFEEDMNQRLQARQRLERDLRRAFTNEEFVLHYQPIVDIEHDCIVGVEALIRWQHPQYGLISPAQFVPLAEEMGLAVPLGEWVVKRACDDATRWPDDIRVAVNISAAHFRRAGLLDLVENSLATSGLKASRLEIEITETALLEDCEFTIAILDKLRAMDVRIAMDDFGTGYASLSYLQKFPFDRIKIDRSFVAEIVNAGSAREIVRTVIALSNGLGMSTTAEGVETAEQLDAIRAEGCSDVQGYLIGRPQPLDQVEVTMREFTSIDHCIGPR